MKHGWWTLAAALVLPVAVGCSVLGRGVGGGSGVSDSTFVSTIVALRRIGADSSLDSMARDSARRTLLRDNGLTVERLEEAARSMAADPEHALAVWREIDERIDREHAPPSMRAPKAPARK
ncbi:MAG TPA: hypothetical protein VF041_19450 [Gemmatimonadaceae bacterium]